MLEVPATQGHLVDPTTIMEEDLIIPEEAIIIMVEASGEIIVEIMDINAINMCVFNKFYFNKKNFGF